MQCSERDGWLRHPQDDDDRKRCEDEEGFSVLLVLHFKMRGWAIHGGTAIPGQPVSGVKQASDPRTNSKNQFNI
jgi:hypothetical protein